MFSRFFRLGIIRLAFGRDGATEHRISGPDSRDPLIFPGHLRQVGLPYWEGDVILGANLTVSLWPHVNLLPAMFLRLPGRALFKMRSALADPMLHAQASPLRWCIIKGPGLRVNRFSHFPPLLWPSLVLSGVFFCPPLWPEQNTSVICLILGPMRTVSQIFLPAALVLLNLKSGRSWLGTW